MITKDESQTEIKYSVYSSLDQKYKYCKPSTIQTIVYTSRYSSASVQGVPNLCSWNVLRTGHLM